MSVKTWKKSKLSINVCVYACLYVWMWTESWMNYVHNLGCFAARLMWSYSLGNQTLRTSACVTLINSAILYIKINVFEQNQTINKCVCVYACMYVWMYGSEQSFEWNMCFAARYSLGNQTPRTSAAWKCFLEGIKINQNNTRCTHVCIYIMQTYPWKKCNLSIHVRVCMHVCMYGGMEKSQ